MKTRALHGEAVHRKGRKRVSTSDSVVSIAVGITFLSAATIIGVMIWRKFNETPAPGK